MTKIEDVVPIIFAPGYFGHYLLWVLDNFTKRGSHTHSDKPFCNLGSSHLQDENNRGAGASWQEIIDSGNYSNFKIIHQYVDVNLMNYTDVDILSESVEQCIVINQNKNFYISAKNNLWEKTYNRDSAMIVDKAVRNELRAKESVTEIREYLSYKAFHDIKYSCSDDYSNNVFSIEVQDLLYNFENVITELVLFLNTTLTEPLEVILSNHKTMMALQRHLDKDNDICNFLDDFNNNINSNMPDNSTLVDEAYIQYYLRDNMNLEIKCFELEEFPKTTTELHKITYPAEELNV